MHVFARQLEKTGRTFEKVSTPPVRLRISTPFPVPESTYAILTASAWPEVWPIRRLALVLNPDFFPVQKGARARAASLMDRQARQGAMQRAEAAAFLRPWAARPRILCWIARAMAYGLAQSVARRKPGRAQPAPIPRRETKSRQVPRARSLRRYPTGCLLAGEVPRSLLRGEDWKRERGEQSAVEAR